MLKLADKICNFCEECEELYAMKIVYKGQISLHTLKCLRKKLYKSKEEEDILFVHGTGKIKSVLQKSVETLNIISIS